MSITLKLRIPCNNTPLVRVLLSQNIAILNNVNYFPHHKMIFIAKGIILPYNKTMEECHLLDGDLVYSLIINEKDSVLKNLLNTNDDINFDQIRKYIPVFGPYYEANLTSINKILEESLTSNSNSNSTSNKDKIVIKSMNSLKELARLHDIKIMKKETSKRSWRKQLVSYLSKNTNNNCCETTNVNYDPAKEPCCEALPMILE